MMDPQKMTNEELLNDYSNLCYKMGKDSEFGDSRIASELVAISERKQLPLYIEILRRMDENERKEYAEK